jgi:hypothetical protein
MTSTTTTATSGAVWRDGPKADHEQLDPPLNDEESLIPVLRVDRLQPKLRFVARDTVHFGNVYIIFIHGRR